MLQFLQRTLIELNINGEKRTAAARPSDTLLSNICRCTGYEEIKNAVKAVLASQA